MNTFNQLKKSVPQCICWSSQSAFYRHALLLTLALGFGSLTFSPCARGSCEEGCDTSNGDTFLGDDAGVGGSQNVAVGSSALKAVINTDISITNNVAVGFAALANSTSPAYDTAIGAGAIQFNTGFDNTGVGYEALYGVSGSSNSTANTAIGYGSLFSDTTGSSNTAVGYSAMSGNTTGSDNTAAGYKALYYNQTGTKNTAYGENSMLGSSTSVPTGSNNTATGYDALFNYTSGSNNTANGYQALYNNTTGGNNAATGINSLYSNTTGGSNTATGINSLYFNTAGNYNTAVGRGALYKNTSSSSTAVGYQALNNNTNGIYNTALGTQALAAVTTNSANTAVGYSALTKSTGAGNTALGENALDNATSGGNNIAIGAAAGANVASGSSNIDIGNLGAVESNTIRIGTAGSQTSTYIAGINGMTVAGGIGVFIDSNGHLGTSTSSARFKDDIQPMEKASEAILSLQPVTFHYKKELDPKGIPQFGLVAEQVEKIDPDLVARDEQGKPYSVRYEAVNAMLLNEFLNEHRRVETHEQTIAVQTASLKEQKSQIAALEETVAQARNDSATQQEEIKALTSSLQKVSDQVQLSKPARTVMVNDPRKN